MKHITTLKIQLFNVFFMAHGMVHDLSRFSAEDSGQMSSLLPDSGALRLWVYPSLAGVISRRKKPMLFQTSFLATSLNIILQKLVQIIPIQQYKSQVPIQVQQLSLFMLSRVIVITCEKCDQ